MPLSMGWYPKRGWKVGKYYKMQDNSIKDSCRTGIGFSNVIRRLEIKYGKNVVEIDSQVDTGTEVWMKPKKS